MNLLKYYSRRDIQKEIVEISKNREIAVNFGDKGYGKRPDVIQFENDVYELAKKGATSFHFSEERWQNPLLIKTGMSKNELDNLRIGFDLILDVDGFDLEYSKLATYYLIEALKFYDIKHITLKYSGNRGIHIAIPFETLPKKVNDIEIKNFFPEGPRIIADYLKNMIKEHLTQAILEKESLQEVAKKLNKNKDEILKNNILNPFLLVDIDTQLISSRHLLRMPYSFHEKSGLVSIPINLNELMNFDKDKAKPENVEVKSKFLDILNIEKQEATDLFDKALYWNLKNKKAEEIKIINDRTYEIPKNAIHEQFFPPCIKMILEGVKTDGRKRALFILLNFFKKTGFNYEQIHHIILDWNKKNYGPLRENYIISQLNWHKKQDKNILPQNCPKRENNIPIMPQDNLYTDLSFCKPDDFCKVIKNPVNYAVRKQRLFGNK